MKPVIVHVIVGLNVGGAELMLKRLALSQKKRHDRSPIVISLTEEGVLGSDFRAAGVTIYCLRLNKLRGLISGLFRLLYIIRVNRPCVVQTWMYHADLIGGIFSRVAGQKLIWGIRTTKLDFGVSKVTRLISKINSLLSYFLPHKIVCAANASLIEHVKIGYNKKIMEVIPNGFDLTRFKPLSKAEKEELRKKLGFRKDDIIVGSVGRNNPDKDFSNLIRASGLINDRNVSFLLIGRGCEKSNFESFEFGDNWHFLGEQKDIEKFIGILDIFVLPSKTEGFPNVLGEAMALEIPCISTDVGDAGVLLGEEGLIVEKEDHVALATAINAMLDLSIEERISIGQKSRKRVSDNFSLDAIVKKFDRVYSSISSS